MTPDIQSDEDSPLWIETPEGPRPMKWGELSELPERWHTHAKVQGGILSTAFLGFRTYGGHLYETALFPDDPTAHGCILARYRSREDAEAGHRTYLESAGASTEPSPPENSRGDHSIF